MPGVGVRSDDNRPGKERPPKLLKPADLPDNFTRSLYKIAPYRGCGHGCRYCDGRAERYFVEGDFEKDIEVRRTVPERLAQELPFVRERGIIGFGSGVTDPYQPLEAVENLTGQCASILASSPRALPAMIMTKSCLPVRDLSEWSRVNEKAGVILLVSITSINETLRERMEPGASSFLQRIETLRIFKAAGCVTGVLAMPFLPGISDDIESIRELYSACMNAGVDFIMPGGLTLRPGRQKACYLNVIESSWPSLREYTSSIYCEDRPSGAPTRKAKHELFRKIELIQNEFEIPYLLPHSSYAKILPSHDSIRILFRDMIELYHDRGIDTEKLRNSADRYDRWLVNLRRQFRKRRSLQDDWLEERFELATNSEELRSVLDNDKLFRFVSLILKEGKRLNYRTLKLS
jgi:DNA repair photolyase